MASNEKSELMVGGIPREHFNVAPATFAPSSVKVITKDGIAHRAPTDEEIREFFDREAYG